MEPDSDLTPQELQNEIEKRLRARLGELEQAARGTRAMVSVTGLGLLVLAALLGVLLYQPSLLQSIGIPAIASRAAEVRVESLLLVDGSNQPRGRWAVGEDGSVRLTLLDERGRDRLRLSVLEGGSPGMSLINTEGSSRAAFGLLPDQTTSLVFADVSGVPRAVLGLTQGDAANLVLADASGVSRVGLGVDAAGRASAILPAEDADPEAGPGG